MRNASILGLALLLAASAGAADKPDNPQTKPSVFDIHDRWRTLAYVEYLRPTRRDEPLRYLNITDNEVREIQLVAEKVVPKVLLNISPVVDGCPCREGPQCTEQVFIVAEKLDQPAMSVGLQLSRVKNAWVVGSVQQWFLRFDALRARQSEMGFDEYYSAEGELLGELPVCVRQVVPPENTKASTAKAETKK
jgi:hypothetical protein